MDFYETISQRRSIRAFQPRKIEADKLARILEATNTAPSAGNLQAYEVYLVREAEKRLALARAAWGQTFLAEAPVCLVFCANQSRSARRYGNRGRSLYSIQDATIACTFAMLAATAEGLATTWVGAFDEGGVSSVIGVAGDVVPVAILAMGYAAEPGHRTSRRGVKDLVHEK